LRKDSDFQRFSEVDYPWEAGRIIESSEGRRWRSRPRSGPGSGGDMNNVDDVLLVDESSIHAAMKLLLKEVRQIVEFAGTIGVAALVQHPPLKEYRNIATVRSAATRRKSIFKP
jgi:hypothetical protein